MNPILVAAPWSLLLIWYGLAHLVDPLWLMTWTVALGIPVAGFGLLALIADAMARGEW